MSAAILHYALSIATAQPASTASLPEPPDQREKVAAIVTDGTAKPLVRVELLSPPETVIALPLVTLRLLLTGLIGGATSESGLASIYAGGPTASGEKSLPGGSSAAHRSIPFGTKVRVTNRANGTPSSCG